MSVIRLAVPSAAPGGLDAEIFPHFGRCAAFTVVDVENGEITRTTTLQNLPHDHEGCTGPVELLAGNGVQVMLAGGMGLRPLEAFMRTGIKVLFAGDQATVKDAIQAFLHNQLPEFGGNGLCHSGCHH